MCTHVYINAVKCTCPFVNQITCDNMDLVSYLHGCDSVAMITALFLYYLPFRRHGVVDEELVAITYVPIKIRMKRNKTG